MKYCFLILFLFGCSQGTTSITPPIQVTCTVAKKGQVSTIICPDGTSSNILDGIQGPIGNAGNSGHSAAIAQSTADTSMCSTGGTVISLGVDINDNGTLETAETTQIATVCNGTKGEQGVAGQNGSSPILAPFTPIGVVSACGGSIDDVNNEVFFRLQNGKLVGSVSDKANGENTRLGIITPGTYYSTGHTSCTFTINSDGSITR
jgi:hypothetical protein